MEKLAALFNLGIKYLYRYRRRYGFLLAALVFCFAIITFIGSVKDGMYDSVYYASQSHYAGDIAAVGYVSDNDLRYLGKDEISNILEAAEEAGINPMHTIFRTMGIVNVIYYNGAALELKYLHGCDWDNESFLFDRMEFEDRSDGPFGEDGIIISAPAAKQINANIGDRILIEIETKTGQRNTGFFFIKGIVKDSSIFGYYKAYVSRLGLNRLLRFEDEDCSVIGFFFDNSRSAEKKRLDLHAALEKRMITAPIVNTRDELEEESDKTWQGVMPFLLTLPVYLTEISDLLNAMDMISYFLYGMMLLIVLVSASVTYRLIIYERTREIGIMRTIGFYSRDMHLVLWTEILTLGFISFAAGLALAWFLGKAVLLLSFSWFPGFEIFMKNGRLTVTYDPISILLHVVFIFVILIMAAFFPVLRASKKNLPGLLSGDSL